VHIVDFADIQSRALINGFSTAIFRVYAFTTHLTSLPRGWVTCSTKSDPARPISRPSLVLDETED
jgi:hypothetical protein